MFEPIELDGKITEVTPAGDPPTATFSSVGNKPELHHTFEIDPEAAVKLTEAMLLDQTLTASVTPSAVERADDNSGWWAIASVDSFELLDEREDA